MGGYLVNFAVYTMAMTGLIFFALMVYKKCSCVGNIKTSKSKMLSIEETITIAPRKTLYVVRAGQEKFLIASDVDKTSLISKLDANVSDKKSITDVKNTEKFVSEKDVVSVIPEKDISKEITPEPKEEIVVQEKEVVKNIQKVTPIKRDSKAEKTSETETVKQSSVDDLPIIVDFQKKVRPQDSVIHNMLKKING
jgi:flagellar biogenesis protein FliO